MGWLKERNAAARRIQILDEAKRYVDFWKGYADLAPELRKELADVSEGVRRNLAIVEEYIDDEVANPSDRSQLTSEIQRLEPADLFKASRTTLYR